VGLDDVFLVHAIRIEVLPVCVRAWFHGDGENQVVVDPTEDLEVSYQFADVEEVFTGLARGVILARRDSDSKLDVLEVLANIRSFVVEGTFDRSLDISDFGLCVLEAGEGEAVDEAPGEYEESDDRTAGRLVLVLVVDVEPDLSSKHIELLEALPNFLGS